MYLPSEPPGSACFSQSCSPAWRCTACRAQLGPAAGRPRPGTRHHPWACTQQIARPAHHRASRRERAFPWGSVGLPGSAARSFQELKHDTWFCACVLRVWLKDRGSVVPWASQSLPLTALPCSVGLAGLGWGVPETGHRLVLCEAWLSVWHRVSRLCWGAGSLHSLLHKLMLY